MSRLTTIAIAACAIALTSAASAAAQVTHTSKVWVDFSLGSATAAQKTLTTQVSFSDGSGEFEDYRTTYHIPRGAAADLGVGYMFSSALGAGISLGGAAHKGPTDLYIRIPHPNFFNRHATDEAETDRDLERTEGSVNLQLVARPVHTDNLSLRLFAGPSYFRLTMDAITDVRYAQVFLGTLNAVDITSFQAAEVEATGWGFHGGADLSYFFTKSFGLGVAARISRGTVEVDESRVISAERPFDVKVGGFQALGGLRLRF